MSDWKDDHVGSAERGENLIVLLRMQSGLTVMGDTRFLPGYCLLLAFSETNHLTDLAHEQRRRFLLDMSLLGEAVVRVCQTQRVNYEILVNGLPILHAHVWPYYSWEPEEHQHRPVWLYPGEYRYSEGQAYIAEGMAWSSHATTIHDLAWLCHAVHNIPLCVTLCNHF